MGGKGGGDGGGGDGGGDGGGEGGGVDGGGSGGGDGGDWGGGGEGPGKTCSLNVSAVLPTTVSPRAFVRSASVAESIVATAGKLTSGVMA